MLIYVYLDKHQFNSFAEIIKINIFFFNVIKSKLSNNDEWITRLKSKIKEIHNTFLEFNCQSFQ